MFVAITLSVIATSVAIWQSVAKITQSLEAHDEQLKALKTDVKSMIKITQRLELHAEQIETLRNEMRDVQKVISIVDSHEKLIFALSGDLKLVKEQSVMRVELLETVKRVEQQLRIALLESRIDPKKIKLIQ